MLAGYLLLTRLRDKGSRWFPLSASVVLFATVFAFVVAVDYLTDYFDPFDAGILLLSLIGVAATVVAFWLLQRYLARRLPLRRVRGGNARTADSPSTTTSGARAAAARCKRRAPIALRRVGSGPRSAARAAGLAEPLKRGGRFSRNADTPSLKSAVPVASC